MMKYLWPRSLAGQLVLSLLAAILAAQVVGFLIFAQDRRDAIIGARHELVLLRAASLVQTLNRLPKGRDDALIQTVLTAATSGIVRFRIASDSPLPVDRLEYRDNDLARSLASRLGDAGDRPVLVKVAEDGGDGILRPLDFFHRKMDERRRDDEDRDGHHGDNRHGDRDDDKHEDKHGAFRYRFPVGLTLAVSLNDGGWLVGELAAPLPRGWGTRTLTGVLLLVFAVSVVGVLVVRRLTRPLGELADAADTLGRGGVPPKLTPSGPGEIRRTIAAFNTMSERLHRFVADRTRMLAAISHDLRSPLTSLRLRAEFITDDADNKQKILNILDEMERITEATQAFARDDMAGGTLEDTDVTRLCIDVTEELSDQGLDVACSATEAAVLNCQPTALKRAIRNLAENAAKYGGRARLDVQKSADAVTITVEDDGPGIPEADFEQVFEPFTRLETSRSKETGGVGLGMAIARNIVRAHGGDIHLQNLTPRGLRVRVSLPLPH